jgi:hypothetical protein
MREAIATASALAQPFQTRIHVIAARSVPLQWSLDQQSAPVRAFAREIRHLVDGRPAQIDILPCVCRRLTDVTQLLPHGAIVIIGGPSHRWWPTREQRLAHDLNGLGHRVMFIHMDDRQIPQHRPGRGGARRTSRRSRGLSICRPTRSSAEKTSTAGPRTIQAGTCDCQPLLRFVPPSI